MNRKSLVIATAAGLVGLVLWIDDDLFMMLSRNDPQGLVHRLCGILEFFFMVPGAAVLGWIVTERFRHSRERLAHVEALARRDRLVVLGRVAAGLAHEVRNPLHNLRLILDELHQVDTATERGRLKGRADANVARIDHAVELVYRLARPRSAAVAEEVCDLATVVAEAVAAERVRAPETVLRCAEVPPAQVACAGDDVRMTLDNLLRNASAAADRSGVELSVHRAGDAWEILVVNHGTLPPWVEAEDDDLATSTKPGGLGLGLSISRQLITEAGGTLRLAQAGALVEARLRLPRSGRVAA